MLLFLSPAEFLVNDLASPLVSALLLTPNHGLLHVLLYNVCPPLYFISARNACSLLPRVNLEQRLKEGTGL